MSGVRIPDVSLKKHYHLIVLFQYLYKKYRSYNSVYIFKYTYADMAELADAPDLGSGVYDVQVQVLSSAGDEE